MSRRIVALLPMKGHSERIPVKNFRPLAGKPLFRWILDTLLSMEEVAEVVINTDARDQLAAHGCVGGGRLLIRDRRPELCGDLVSMNRVLADDVGAVEADVYVMTHATNPLLCASTIRGALAAYFAAADAGTHDSLFSVNRHRSRFYSAGGRALNHDPSNLVRTQDLEPWFEENSSVYVFSRASFARTGARIGERPLMFPTPRLESVDVDDWEGWALAEALAATASQRVER